MEAYPLPLFPLNTVLFPGGTLGLRVFEARYLDLVRECTRNGQGFGVCLILAGNEVGAPALPAAVGCEAAIVDFATGVDGLLTLTVEGRRRFHVERSKVRDNGLIMAEVSWLTTPSHRVPDQYQLLALLLRKILERAGSPHDQFTEANFGDAHWVSWRLAEWLPLSPTQRQALLQESEPDVRLQRLLELIPDPTPLAEP